MLMSGICPKAVITPKPRPLLDVGERVLTLADLKTGTVIIERQRSKRIQTRTKGKRKIKRLVKEYIQRMERQIQKTAWEMFHYKAMGKYP